MNYINPTKLFAHVGRLAHWEAGEKPAPVTIEIDLTNVCSLGCQFCHYRHTHVAGPWANKAIRPVDFSDTGRVADTQRFLTLFTELKAAGVQGVVLSGGGEPTLHPDFDLLVSAAKDAGLAIGLYTLGGHISEARGALLREALSFAVVSLDCVDGETYAKEKHVPASRFSDALLGIRRMAGGSCVVGVSFLLHADNWRQAKDMLDVGRRAGANYVTFRPTVNVEMDQPSVLTDDRAWVTESLPLLWELAAESDVEIDPDRFVEYRDWVKHPYSTCYGIRLVSQITPDGRVWVCMNRRGMPGSELGNLHTESFADIWSRHPGQWTDFSQCRAMCRLHLNNTVLASVLAPKTHAQFL